MPVRTKIKGLIQDIERRGSLAFDQILEEDLNTFKIIHYGNAW